MPIIIIIKKKKMQQMLCCNNCFLRKFICSIAVLLPFQKFAVNIFCF